MNVSAKENVAATKNAAITENTAEDHRETRHSVLDRHGIDLCV